MTPKRSRRHAVASALRLAGGTSPPSGALLASGDQGGLKLWRAPDGLLLRTLAGFAGDVGSVAFTPDGSQGLRVHSRARRSGEPALSRPFSRSTTRTESPADELLGNGSF